jgi:hypothetical protein
VQRREQIVGKRDMPVYNSEACTQPCLHVGHVLLSLSHGATHRGWNTWRHGRASTSSPTPNSSLQQQQQQQRLRKQTIKP